MYEIATIANIATGKFGNEAFFAKLMKAVCSFSTYHINLARVV
jgi:hypothetical protein